MIGAGACGLAVARRLAELRPDESVTVIEAMRVGYGTSGLNAGFMLSHHSHGGIKHLEVGRRDDRLFSVGYVYLRKIVEPPRSWASPATASFRSRLSPV